jgi:hypothetical protein
MDAKITKQFYILSKYLKSRYSAFTGDTVGPLLIFFLCDISQCTFPLETKLFIFQNLLSGICTLTIQPSDASGLLTIKDQPH